jgi:hypothetical protein
MKTTLFLSTILLVTNLYCRVNPFEPTQTFIDKKEQYLKAQKEKELKQKLEEELSKIEKEVKQKEQKSIAVAKTIKPAKKIEPQKPKETIAKENIHPLPFINIYNVQRNLMIEVDKKYSFLQTLILPDQKKMLFDFIGDESFYTIRDKLKNPYFISYAIGTHQEEKFFRIVIDLKNNILLYKTAVDKKNNIIVIKPLKR